MDSTPPLPASRSSRLAGALVFVPLWVIAGVWGISNLLSGILQLRYARPLHAILPLVLGSAALWLAGASFRRSRAIFDGRSFPWTAATRAALGGDALLVLLFLMVIPKINDLRRYVRQSEENGRRAAELMSRDASQKTFRGPLSELGSLRSALSIYYNDTQGRYPARLEELTPKYLPALAPIAIPYRDGSGRAGEHPATAAVHYFSSVQSDDQGGWGYVADPKSPSYGTVFVNCAHRDLSGRRWLDH